MAYLGVKCDGNYNPHRAKIRIVILGNHKYWAFNKSQRLAPVLSYSYLWLPTSKYNEKRRILHQGDYKYAFYNTLLTDDVITIVRPPLGDPNSGPDNFWPLNKKIYGLRRSPQHRFNLITDILGDMGIPPSKHVPCLFPGVIDNGTPPSSPRKKSTWVCMLTALYYSWNQMHRSPTSSTFSTIKSPLTSWVTPTSSSDHPLNVIAEPMATSCSTSPNSHFPNTPPPDSDLKTATGSLS